jgi:ATP-binding cassette subfamily F protein 3
MGSIRLQNVGKQFGGQIVLNDVTLDLHSGQVAALIGPNGAGKTTIFRLIAGQYPPDTGTVTLSKGLAVGYLAQEPTIATQKTLRDAVAEAFTDLIAMEQRLQQLGQELADEHDGPRAGELMTQYDRLHARFEAAGGYSFEQRLNEVLGGLGFSPADYALPVSALSGGQKCRAALAQLLLAGAADASGASDQFLLLDEPTNHLDIDAVRWLEKFLAGHHGGAVIISHDRYLLDRLAERTIEVQPTPSGGRLESYPGNYTNFVQTRELRRLSAERQYEQDKAFVEKEREYIARYGAGQRARQAQGRLKRLERQIAAGEFVLERSGQRRDAKLEFTDPNRASKSPGTFGGAGQTAGTRAGTEIVRVEGLRKQYGDKVLFTDLALELYAGQRLGITGPNGTGKTTLLKILLGQVEADTGKVRVAPTARVGYFAQEGTGLDPAKTIVDEILAVRPHLLERDARHIAARYLFSGEDVFKRIGSLSGGEQSRVRFMKLILTAPDVLILDEPTNHLDIPSREALEESLAEFPGTIIAVSHDRYFLDRIAQKLLVLRPDTHHLYPGNYTYYIEQIEQQKAAAEARAEAERAAAQEQQRRRQKAARQAARAARGHAAGDEPSALEKQLKKLKLDALETYIHERETRVTKLQERFGDATVYKDPAQLERLQTEFDQVKEELAAAEEEWLTRAAQ